MRVEIKSEQATEKTAIQEKQLNFNEAVRLLQLEFLHPGLIKFFTRRVGLDFQPEEGLISYESAIEHLKDQPEYNLRQTLIASSGLVGHSEMAIVYAWNDTQRFSLDSLYKILTPASQVFLAGVYPGFYLKQIQNSEQSSVLSQLYNLRLAAHVTLHSDYDNWQIDDIRYDKKVRYPLVAASDVMGLLQSELKQAIR